MKTSKKHSHKNLFGGAVGANFKLYVYHNSPRRSELHVL